jgi:hypothetical protein
MEVSMRNIPITFTDAALQRHLDPIIASLNILDWRCNKFGDKPRGRIIFLEKHDGARFMAKNRQAQLHLMGTPVYCSVSKFPPDTFALRSLRRDAEARVANTETQAINHDVSVFFQIHGVSCGHYEFDNGDLVFVPDLEWKRAGSVKFSDRQATIRFLPDFKIEMPIHTINEVIAGTSTTTLTLTLTESPVFSSKGMVDIAAALTEAMNRHSLGAFNSAFKAPTTRERLARIDPDHERFTQHSLVYQLDVLRLEFSEKLRILEAKDLLTITPAHLPAAVLHPVFTSHSTTKEIERAFEETIAKYTSRGKFDFSIFFQLQKLVWNGYLRPNTVMELAAALEQQPGNISADAIKRLFPEIPYMSPHVDSSMYSVNEIMKLLVRKQRDIDYERRVRGGLSGTSNNMTLVYSVTVTPTRVLLEGPEWESGNRVLRKFSDHTDCFIRVHFADENGEGIFFDAKMSQGCVYDKFRAVMESGLRITGRTYSFLGWSNSSLRSQSVWFCCPFDHNGVEQTYHSIVGSLGEFAKIRTPGKHAARIGQAFSETPIVVSLQDHDIKVSYIPDVQVGDRIFTDGIGTVSEEVVEIINRAYPRKARRGDATCFQIRWAGAKGVLSLDTTLPGRQICIRHSMEKFSSKDTTNLEICDRASAIPCVLNRQLIKIMEDMNVSSSWFMGLQKQEIHRLRGVVADGYGIEAFLRKQGIGDSIKLPSLYSLFSDLEIDYRKDRFLRSVVEIVVLQELRLLKYKARIPVKEGVTLFGVVDETGFLKEREVYATYESRTNTGRYSTIIRPGPVLVTRAPALHPGDIQTVHQVIPPDSSPLRQLSNCIVFSRQGSRDLPSQLSGGDLDGDLYSIIWAPEVTSSNVLNYKPADYPRVKPKELDHTVQKGDIIDFFIDFMKNDHLGIIATRHMILADQKPKGTMDEACLALAELHSTAVDFPKSGIPVQMTDLPRASFDRPDL